MATTPKFDKAIPFILEHEGEYSNDPKDPGGETRWGLCYRWEKEQVEKMKTMNKEQAKAYATQYYFDTYWQDSGAENYPDKIALAIFDCAVNQGVNIIKTWVRGLGDQLTLDKIIVWRMCRYVERVDKSPEMKVFLHGWMNRLCDLYREVKDW